MRGSVRYVAAGLPPLPSDEFTGCTFVRLLQYVSQCLALCMPDEGTVTDSSLHCQVLLPGAFWAMWTLSPLKMGKAEGRETHAVPGPACYLSGSVLGPVNVLSEVGCI